MPKAKRGTGPTVREGSVRKGTTALHEPVWAVIADHYVAFDMTYDEARAESDRLKSKRQPGVVIVTNEAAKRMANGAAGVTASSLPDMKF